MLALTGQSVDNSSHPNKTLILTSKDVKELISTEEIIANVEKALKILGTGDSLSLPSRIWHHVPLEQSQESLIYVVASTFSPEHSTAVKVLTLNDRNPIERRLPHMLGIIIMFDSSNGFPSAVMDGVLITNARTGALAALGAKYMARGDSEKVAVLGSRALAKSALQALMKVGLKIRQATVYSASKVNRERFAVEMSASLKLPIQAKNSAQEAVDDADIIITATSSSTPILLDKFVKAGAHISAIGSKGEVEPKLLSRSRVIAETNECKSYGKISMGIQQNFITESNIAAEFSQVIRKEKPGRASPEEITFFDSIGHAIEDAAVCKALYDKARAMGRGAWMDMTGELEIS